MDEYFILQAKTLPKARKALKEIIEFYIEDCKSEGRTPCRQNVETFAHTV